MLSSIGKVVFRLKFRFYPYRLHKVCEIVVHIGAKCFENVFSLHKSYL